MKYIVQQLFINGWENAPWTGDCGEGPFPAYCFDCELDANLEIQSFLADVKASECLNGENYDESDFRVIEVSDDYQPTLPE